MSNLGEIFDSGWQIVLLEHLAIHRKQYDGFSVFRVHEADKVPEKSMAAGPFISPFTDLFRKPAGRFKPNTLATSVFLTMLRLFIMRSPHLVKVPHGEGGG